MTAPAPLLLINPQMTSRRSARFPLSLLALASSVEDRYPSTLLDGNVEVNYLERLEQLMRESHFVAVGVTVMGGPQVQSAIEVSKLVRRVAPMTPIIWGGYFPTLYSDAAINADYVDFLIRGQGERSLRQLLDALGTESRDYGGIAGLTWKRSRAVVHNEEQPFTDARSPTPIPFHLLGDPGRYLHKTFLGRRTAAHQASVGCRFRCTFCGVASMFNGATSLPPAERLRRDLLILKQRFGADSIQFFDHNFFDREVDMMPLLEVLAGLELPWWCYARADALLNLSPAAWRLVRQSRLSMAYIGAESPSDAMLKSIRKGTRAEQTLAVAELCRHQGVVPELSFMVAPPHDPEGETERTFEFIREVKRVNPESEIIIYIYTPLPRESLSARARERAASLVDADGQPIQFPKTPEEWTERRWVDYACHADAPWLTKRLRRRIQDFVTVLRCRFPTEQDVRSPNWAKGTLRALASWRYNGRRYNSPWELSLSQKLVRLADPRVTSI